MISDNPVRQAIRNEKTRSVVVEASAGTGKTTLITDRVKALVESGIPLEKLAVVTFTEAAASELRGRIREILPPESKRTMDQAWITTIHGFASRILREYFHLCDGVPEFSMEASHFSRSELEIHWDLFLAGAGTEALRASSDSLRHPGSKILLDIAEQIEKHRWFTDSSPLGNTREALIETTAEWKRRLESLSTLCSSTSDTLQVKIGAAIESLENSTAVKVNKQGGSAGNWGGKESLKEVKAVLESYNKQGFRLINAFSSALPHLPAIEHLVIPFVNSMRSIWDSDPTRLSFNDLLHSAWQAVSGSRELRGELNERFSHIFIDEFQDTSLVQVKLFTSLLEQSGMRHKLTVVGDPKQSIFGWRSADIETYKDTLRKLEEGNALSETIEVNFRSAKTVINFVNSFGENLFKQITPEEEPFSCEYSTIQPRPGAGEGRDVTVHRLPDMKAPEMAVLEAEAIAGLVEDPGTTAILFRTGTRLDSLVQALDRNGIPYRVEASRDFHKRSEVLDTAYLLKVILCPSDEYSLVQTLRSVFFGISDIDITLWKQGGSPDSVTAALNLLKKLRQVARVLPPGPFMETLFRNTCLLPAVKASGYQVTRRLGNMRFILETAGRSGDYSHLLETLMGKAPVSAEEPSAPPENHTGVVTLTTIHRAKGLAWNHVILANPGGAFNNSTQAVIASDRSLSAGIKIAEGLTASYDNLSKREKARSRAEYRRLLYVAVTRPKQKLDIFLPGKMNRGSPADILHNALGSSTRFFTERIITPENPPTEVTRESPVTSTTMGNTEFTLLYPASIPELQVDRDRQMRLGTEVHGIMEFIDFEDPHRWLENNIERLKASLEFPEEAAKLAGNFFHTFNMDEAEIIGREYPLTVNGKQLYIDLLLRRNGILEAVDYKTDHGDIEERTEFYHDKQLIYAETLQEITGIQVKTKLVFLRHSTVTEI